MNEKEKCPVELPSEAVDKRKLCSALDALKSLRFMLLKNEPLDVQFSRAVSLKEEIDDPARRLREILAEELKFAIDWLGRTP